jgi:hypothetical protein
VWSLLYLVTCRLFGLMALLFRSSGSKELEIVVLRHELSILRRQTKRPKLRESDRVLLARGVREVCHGHLWALEQAGEALNALPTTHTQGKLAITIR